MELILRGDIDSPFVLMTKNTKKRVKIFLFAEELLKMKIHCN